MSHEIRAKLEQEYTPMQRRYQKLTGIDPVQMVRMGVSGADITHLVAQPRKEYVQWLERQVESLCKKILEAQDHLASLRAPATDEHQDKKTPPPPKPPMPYSDPFGNEWSDKKKN